MDKTFRNDDLHSNQSPSDSSLPNTASLQKHTARPSPFFTTPPHKRHSSPAAHLGLSPPRKTSLDSMTSHIDDDGLIEHGGACGLFGFFGHFGVGVWSDGGSAQCRLYLAEYVIQHLRYYLYLK
jgi:hypothetical protein